MTDAPYTESVDAQTESAPAELVPPGARCAVHPDVDAAYLCSRCGSFACEACAFSRVPERAICTTCAEGGLAEPIPWERRKEIGTWRALMQTTKLASTSPTEFFRTPATQEGLVWPVVYGIAVYTIGQVVGNVLTMIGLMLMGGGLALIAPEPEVGGILAGYFACWAIGIVPLTLLQAPAMALMGIVGGASLTHLTLVAVKARRAPFEDTVRAVSYSNAPYFLYFVPCFGPFIAWFWMVGVEMIAVRETHRIGTDRAALAVLGYRILLIVLLVGGYAALIAFFIAMAPQPPPPP